MSIKPIDFHLTYASTINESKAKQVDFNKVKDTNQLMQNKQEAEVERNKTRIIESEESKGKKINQENPKDHNQNKGKDSKRRQAASKEKEERPPLKNSDSKGLKIDIMI